MHWPGVQKVKDSCAVAWLRRAASPGLPPPSRPLLPMLLIPNFDTLRRFHAMRTPEEKLLSGGPKEEFGRMIFSKKNFKKNLPRGTVLKFSHRRRQLLVEVRRGARTCDARCMLDYHLQLSLTLACINALSKTLPNIHGAPHVQCHASPPRAAADGSD